MAASAGPHLTASASRPATPSVGAAAGKRIRSETLAQNHSNDNPRKRQHRQLPEGSCNFRDIEVGAQAPICGCVRFWELDGAELHCVCGHHACFHKTAESFPNPDLQLSYATRQSHYGQSQQTITKPQYSFRTEPQTLSEWQAGAQPSAPLILAGQEHESPENEVRHRNEQAAAALDSNGLPPYPSMLLLDRDKQKTASERMVDSSPQSAPRSDPRQPSLRAGLGLYYRGLPSGARVPSPSPTIAEPLIAMSLPGSDSQIPSTRQASTTDGARYISPSHNFMRQIMESKMQMPGPVDTAIANGPQDQPPSATEVARPDPLGTPSLPNFQPIIQETRRLLQAFTGEHPSTTNGLVASGSMVAPGVKVHDRESVAQLHVALDNVLVKLNTFDSQNMASFQLNACIKSVLGRLDMLENASFAHISPSVYYENHENVDTRLIDVEQQLSEQLKRIDAIENTQAAFGYGATASFASEGSHASDPSGALITSAADQMDVDTRIEDMEARLVDLETNTLPSAKDPWEIEVVLLPWGRLLGGIWQAATVFGKNASASASVNATQDGEGNWQEHREARSSAKASSSFRSTQSGWSCQAIQAWARHSDEWLYAKACSNNGIVYHRLRSRGLVRTVTLKSSGAITIQRALFDAFGSVLGITNGSRALKSSEVASNLIEDNKFLGLEAPIIPLRKVHKSSRLRFLSPAEMVTPALWTSEFLSSGVLMRAPGGQKRLFVTTREAYMQESTITTIGWTWEKIRNLPTFNHSAQGSQAEAGENEQPVKGPVTAFDRNEACWAHHALLDNLPASSSASFASFHSHVSQQHPLDAQDIPHQHGQAWHTHEIPEDQRTIEYPVDQRPVYQPITPISDFPTQLMDNRRRGLRQRTVSMPATETTSALKETAPDNIDRSLLRPSSAGKRRIHSFEAVNNPLVDLLPSFVHKTDARAPQSRKKRRVESRDGNRRQRSVSWDLPAKADKFEVDADELDHYRRHLSRTNSAVTTSVLRMVDDSDAYDSSNHRTVVRKQTPSFFQPTPVSRVSDNFQSSQMRRRERCTTEDFFADLQAMDAKGGICQEVGCDHIHCTTSEGSQDGRGHVMASSSSKGRGTTPFLYATPYSGPVIRSREDNDTIVQALMESDDDNMTGFDYEDEAEEDNGISESISDDMEDDDDDDDEDDVSEDGNEGASQAWSGMMEERRHESGSGEEDERIDVSHEMHHNSGTKVYTLSGSQRGRRSRVSSSQES